MINHEKSEVDIKPIDSATDAQNIMENKTVLITGSSSGIGAGVAEHLAELGYGKLALAALEPDLLEEVAQMCRAKNPGVKVLCLPGDLTEEANCNRVVNDTVQEFGGTYCSMLFSNWNIYRVRNRDRKKGSNWLAPSELSGGEYNELFSSNI